MKIKLLQENVPLYGDTEHISGPIRLLQRGEHMEFVKIRKSQGKQWAEVTLTDGTRGIIPADTSLFVMTKAVTQEKMPLYAAPSRERVKMELKKNTSLDLLDLVEQDGQQWVLVQDASGNQGYIDGKAKITRKIPATKKIGLQNMLIGGAFFVLGTIVTIATYSSASSSGGTYYICWGAILFGIVQFIQGLIQFLTAPS